jgi:hypothetical protein
MAGEEALGPLQQPVAPDWEQRPSHLPPLPILFGEEDLDECQRAALQHAFTERSVRASNVQRQKAIRVASMKARRSTSCRLLLSLHHKIPGVPALEVGASWSSWANADISQYDQAQSSYEEAKTALMKAVDEGLSWSHTKALRCEMSRSQKKYIAEMVKFNQRMSKRNTRRSKKSSSTEQSTFQASVCCFSNSFHLIPV